MIGIIFIGDLYVCPYLRRYTDECEQNNIQYDVLFWNRSGDKIDKPKNFKYFDYKSDENLSFIKKLFDFLKFRRWVKKKIRKTKYEKLILLSTLSGVLLFDVLKKYKNKYVFDIRDYSYEYFKPFYNIEKNIIKNSFYTCISSLGFKNFLPELSYRIIHNMQMSEATIESTFKKKSYGDVLNVVWNGTMRYFEHQKNIILKLANDPRFVLYFHGSGPELNMYEEFVEKNNISNVYFTGKYSNEEKILLLRDADILNNSYWIEKVNEVLYAISNRFYDGIVFKIPQLVEKGTFKTSICEKNNIGIGLSTSDDDFASKLYEWYFSIDVKLFETNCKAILESVLADEKVTKQSLDDFLKGD